MGQWGAGDVQSIAEAVAAAIAPGIAQAVVDALQGQSVPTVDDLEPAATAGAIAALDAAGLVPVTGLVVASGMMTFGEAQSWIVEPVPGQAIAVYRLKLVQGSAGVVRLYQGTALGDAGNTPLDGEMNLGGGAPYVEADPFSPLWTTAAGEGLILARSNMTTSIAYTVRYKLI